MNLLDYSLEELKDYVKNLGFPAFRGKQIFDAMIQGKKLNEVTNIPKDIKEKIQNDYPAFNVIRKLVSKDGTKKYVFQFPDGEIVESVLLSYEYGNTVCVSTQVGCRMGCAFCASGINGLIRNLTPGEILEQVIYFNSEEKTKEKVRNVTNIVLMGSGEPLDNYDNVTKFLRLVSSKDGLNISQRNISLSTSGLAMNIYKLADDGFNITLTISLHAPNDEIRKTIMPVANAFSIDEILKACKYYFDKTGRRVIFEYALIKDVNCSDNCIKELATKLKGLTCHVNLIPLNSVKEKSLDGTTRKEAYVICGKLEKLGISATVRRTMGEDIEGACGQLRNKVKSEIE
ncbi:MAG: 23S rRNA (adenine(2503)-C(2))-methyltransferase RlmN [Clostridia bacterium]|nr:23S rRNA (adenine(2503)-C(2))-methyltransferase RlmN [Clostridia bacterium]